MSAVTRQVAIAPPWRGQVAERHRLTGAARRDPRRAPRAKVFQKRFLFADLWRPKPIPAAGARHSAMVLTGYCQEIARIGAVPALAGARSRTVVRAVLWFASLAVPASAWRL